MSNSSMACQCCRYFGQRNAEQLQEPQRNMAYSDSLSHALNYGSWFYATLISGGCSSQLAAGAVCLNPAMNDRNLFQCMALALALWLSNWERTWGMTNRGSEIYLKLTTLVNMWWYMKTDAILFQSYSWTFVSTTLFLFVSVTTYILCLYVLHNMHIIHSKVTS